MLLQVVQGEDEELDSPRVSVTKCLVRNDRVRCSFLDLALFTYPSILSMCTHILLPLGDTNITFSLSSAPMDLKQEGMHTHWVAHE